MEKMVAYCGLVCTNCPTFLATQADDDTAREKTAVLYERKFGLKFKPEDINCDGCLSAGGKLIGYCHACEIRKCAMEKQVGHCTACESQPCDKLERFHEFSPDAKAGFENLKSRLR